MAGVGGGGAASRRGRLLGRARGAALRAGIDVRWAGPASSVAALRRRLLADRGVDLVVDGGANVGQYGLELRGGGYRGRILSYEPLADAAAQLAGRCAADPRWQARRAALGTEDGEAEIHVAANSVSSSLLPTLERHVTAAADSRTERTEPVRTVRLDRDAGAELEDARAPYLKLDVQGYELSALEGAAGVLDRLVAVELELSLVPLYEGAPTLPALFEYLAPLGFKCVGIYPAFSDRASGRVLQADGVFERR